MSQKKRLSQLLVRRLRAAKTTRLEAGKAEQPKTGSEKVDAPDSKPADKAPEK